LAARTATISDVARRAGVSTATASRTLSGGAGVRPVLRGRVLAAASELGYFPNPHARALASAREATVAVIVNDLSNPFFSEVIGGMHKIADLRGRMLLIATAYRDARRELEALTYFRSRRVQSLVLAGSGREDRESANAITEQLRAFEEAGGKAVLLGRQHAHADAVLIDNVGGARELAEALAGLGHRRFAVVAGPVGISTTRERLAGVRLGLQRHGLQLPDEMVVHSDYTRESGSAAAAELLARRPRPTALLAFNDVMAVAALGEARRAGLRVPEDLSVAGFDDVPLASQVLPALTTVRVPMAEMGALGLEMALEAPGAAIRVEHLPTTLVIRESTGTPPG
jgi:LacI family transcriptional regulator